ncbi:GNAT family N-acetyltransferase [Ornithinibacillus scapharcae]|uniref:GNAT family N-acetyltransferase n=1 Tax=Ornithinibacillus scapharcae TaxID=1147159 RepID=UPI000225B5EF|nr:GNAT family N-acetyltransferase [Ornithinibacillus scapharcae]
MLEYCIIPYDVKYAEPTVQMWRDSKEAAIGQKEIHSFDNHVYFLNQILSQEYQVELVLLEENVIGMVAFNESEINQLYIHKDYQGFGIGTKLLDRVKACSKGKIQLNTFEINKNAQRFYERNGFKIIGRGHENEENLPDILYEWNTGE